MGWEIWIGIRKIQRARESQLNAKWKMTFITYTAREDKNIIKHISLLWSYSTVAYFS